MNFRKYINYVTDMNLVSYQIKMFDLEVLFSTNYKKKLSTIKTTITRFSYYNVDD